MLTSRSTFYYKKKLNKSIQKLKQTIHYLVENIVDEEIRSLSDAVQRLDQSYWITKILSLLSDLEYQDTISINDIKPLQYLLEQRWSFILHISPNERYTITPYSKINAICMVLAQYIATIIDKSCYQILMPTIQVGVSSVTLTELKDHSLTLHDFIDGYNDGLGCNTFIEVLYCFEYAIATGKLCYTTLVSGDEPIELESVDKDRIINQSAETKALWDAICKREAIRVNGESFGTALTHLAYKLWSGGIHGGNGGQETQAGKDANEGIFQFCEWLASLKEDEQTWLMQLSAPSASENFGRIWSRISNPTDRSNLDIRYCVDILSSKIRSIIDSNKKIFDVYPHNCKKKSAGSFIQAEELVKTCFEKLKIAIKSQMYNITWRFTMHERIKHLLVKHLFSRNDLYKFGDRNIIIKILSEYSNEDFKNVIASQLGGPFDQSYYWFFQLLRDVFCRCTLSSRFIFILHLIDRDRVEVFIKQFKALYIEYSESNFDSNVLASMFHATKVDDGLYLQDDVIDVFATYFENEIIEYIELNGINAFDLVMFKILKSIFNKHPELIGTKELLVKHLDALEKDIVLRAHFCQWLSTAFIPMHPKLLSDDDFLYASQHVKNKAIFNEYFKDKLVKPTLLPFPPTTEWHSFHYFPTKTSVLRNGMIIYDGGMHPDQRALERAVIIYNECLELLKPYGMTEELMSTASFPCLHDFSIGHQKLLVYLITGEVPTAYVSEVAQLPQASRLSPERAVREVSLLNEQKCLALLQLYQYGMTHDLLFGCVSTRNLGESFTANHRLLLVSLIRTGGRTPQEAIDIVKEKSCHEALLSAELIFSESSSGFRGPKR